MEITIKINGQAVSVEVSYEVYECLCESDRKAENLSYTSGGAAYGTTWEEMGLEPYEIAEDIECGTDEYDDELEKELI